jgi:hypothetical protein
MSTTVRCTEQFGGKGEVKRGEDGRRDSAGGGGGIVQ